jgi:acyl-CoA synthetase (AMP-forming)/AMP-acid ligase II/acyl carrier protein
MEYFKSASSRRVGIIIANNVGYIESMFGCIEAGNIAVPLINTDDQYRINAARVDQFITPTEDGAWMRRRFTPSNISEPALISFTSGTEGAPKGVILTHENLADVINRLNAVMQLDDSISEYIGVPVYHSFGFGRCRAVATAGGKFFIPSKGFNPSEISEMLRKGEINAISAVPSLWRILLANKDVIGSYGKRVRWIEIGSQYMNRQEKEAMKDLSPEAKIVQHYGLTEASRTTLLQINEVEGDLLESVGQALGGVEVKQTLEGQIAIRGNHVALSYLMDGQEVELRDDDGWFLTKDLGSLKNGYLYYEGRADDVINCGGIKVHPEALETKIYASIGCSKGLAICRKTDSMRGDGFLVATTKELEVDKQQLRKAVLEATQKLGVNASDAITIVDVDIFPKTATGKIQRRRLAEWYALQSSDKDQSVEAKNFISTDSAPIQDIFRRILNLSEIQPHDSFVSLGGDSLSYIQFSMQLEDYLGSLPNKWEYMTLSELEKLVPQRQKKATIETDILLRAVAIFAIVLNHTSQDFIPEKYIAGGSLLLLTLAGFNFARFQGHKLKGNLFESITPILRALVTPYLLISLGYQILHQKIDLSVLLLFNNFIYPIANHVKVWPFPYWFICLLVQIIIVFSSLFSVKYLRHLANSSPWFFGTIPLIIGMCVSTLSMHIGYPNEPYYPRLPHILFWLFALGWCLHFAKSRSEKLITTAILLATLLMSGVNMEKFWILFGGSMLLWVPLIPMPLVVRPVVRAVGAATFYIYMTNMLLIYSLTHNILGIYSPPVEMLVALLGGLLVMFAVQRLRQFLVAFRKILGFSRLSMPFRS